MTRDSFVFYRSFLEGLSQLDDKDRLACYDAITKYGLDGECNAEGIAAAVIALVKPVIDSNNQKYENGKKGGRPKNQTETKQEPNDNQTITKAEPNHNQTETKAEPYVKCKMLNDKCDMSNKESYSAHKRKPKARQPSFSNQRSYDYGTLEVQLLGRAYE